MKKNRLKTLLAGLLLAAMLSGCQNAQPNEPAEDTAEEVTTPAQQTSEPQSLQINGAALDQYVVNYNKKDGTGGAEAFAYFNEKIGEAYGVTLKNSTAIKDDRCEIMIAQDAGDQTIAEAFAQNPEGLIGVSGKRIFFLGANYAALCQVIDAFLAKAEGAGAEKTIRLTATEAVALKKESFKAMSYNLRVDIDDNGRSKNFIADMANTVLGEEVDVFGTQETSTSIFDALRAKLPDYNYYRGMIYEGAGQISNAVFWKAEKFKLVEQGHRFMSDTPTVKSKYEDSNAYRGFSYVILESRETGNRFLFISVHTDYRGPETVRVAQLKVLTAFLKEKAGNDFPAIIVGDFNSTPTKNAVTSFDDDNPRLGMTLKVAKTKGDTGSTLVGSEFTTRHDPSYVYDYIFITTDRIIAEYYSVVVNFVDGKSPSDHLPVVSTLTLYK